jgi:hypothetical protein
MHNRNEAIEHQTIYTYLCTLQKWNNLSKHQFIERYCTHRYFQRTETKINLQSHQNSGIISMFIPKHVPIFDWKLGKYEIYNQNLLITAASAPTFRIKIQTFKQSVGQYQHH